MDYYRTRVVDQILKNKLYAMPAVVIEGLKWCGKTTTAEQIAKSKLYINDPKLYKTFLTISETDPEQLLVGNYPRLIDEWQLTPKLWDAIRYFVDHNSRKVKIILTGSSVPVNRDDIIHSGAGRFARLKMRTMSLAESGDSNCSVSLKKLFNKTCKKISGKSNIDFDQICYLICRGGWPELLKVPKNIALQIPKEYYESLINEDIFRVDNFVPDTTNMRKFMKSYARNQGTQIKIEAICKDILVNDNTGINNKTVTKYVRALNKIFVIEDVEAWNPNIRSKTAIRTSDTRYFTDPSIATAALHIGPGDLKNDINTLGLLFETLAIRDLRIYSQSFDGDVYHYRDANGLECDAVIHKKDGHYGLIEIKIGGDTAIDMAAETLLTLKNTIDSKRINEPDFMVVLTALGEYAYTRKDGIHVIPIGCLGP